MKIHANGINQRKILWSTKELLTAHIYVNSIGTLSKIQGDFL